MTRSIGDSVSVHAPATLFYRTCNSFTHLLAINTPLIGFQHDEFLARNVQPGALNLLHVVLAGVIVGGDHTLHLLRRDCEAAARRPHTVAFSVEDGRLIDIAGADEAGEKSLSAGRSIAEGRASLVAY